MKTDDTSSASTPDADGSTETTPIDLLGALEAEPRQPLEAYYDGSGFWAIDADGWYMSIKESALKRRLRGRGYSDLRDGKLLSEVDVEITRIEDERRILYAGPLAGFRKGLYSINGRKFLVTDSPQLIEAKKGDWPIIKQIIRGMLYHDEYDQRPYFYGWLQRRMMSIYDSTWLPAQALAFAGPPGSGKSLTQNYIITPLLGGRSAKPHKSMSSGSPFNSDTAGAEHLMIEDEAASLDFPSRLRLGQQIKQITVNKTQRVEAKYKEAFTASLLQGLTISLNDTPEDLHVLPPLADGLSDKLMLLKVGWSRMPMPTETMEEMEEFQQVIQSELRHFAFFLLCEFTAPKALISSRYGIVHFHHPDILEALGELAPWQKLLELIDFDRSISVDSDPVETSSVALAARLQDSVSPVSHDARKLLSYHGACGSYLAQIEKHRPDRVKRRKTNMGVKWLIMPPKENPKRD